MIHGHFHFSWKAFTSNLQITSLKNRIHDGRSLDAVVWRNQKTIAREGIGTVSKCQDGTYTEIGQKRCCFSTYTIHSLHVSEWNISWFLLKVYPYSHSVPILMHKGHVSVRAIHPSLVISCVFSNLKLIFRNKITTTKDLFLKVSDRNCQIILSQKA
jgi:hypothetical protein